MSKFIVECIFGGTSLKLAISASTAERAIAKAKKCRQGRNASCYIVFDRKMNWPRLVGVK